MSMPFLPSPNLGSICATAERQGLYHRLMTSKSLSTFHVFLLIVYSVVIEWNKLLFEEFIPRAWRFLLEVLVQEDGIINVFRAWPSKQPATLTGDTVYWQSLPTRLLHFVVSSKSPVWPLYSPHNNSPMKYKVLDQLMTTFQPAIQDTVLRSLTTMGLELTRPPAYLADEIRKLADPRYVILTPETAHDALLVNTIVFHPIFFANICRLLERS